jgi:hypothetical protein
MQNQVINEAAIALQKEWGLQLPDTVSEEEILKQLAKRVTVLIDQGPETFFQLMYRLDISEKKLNGVMQEEYVAENIARLIYDRQFQKIQSRQLFKSMNEEVDPELKW